MPYRDCPTSHSSWVDTVPLAEEEQTAQAYVPHMWLLQA